MDRRRGDVTKVRERWRGCQGGLIEGWREREICDKGWWIMGREMDEWKDERWIDKEMMNEQREGRTLGASPSVVFNDSWCCWPSQPRHTRNKPYAHTSTQYGWQFTEYNLNTHAQTHTDTQALTECFQTNGWKNDYIRGWEIIAGYEASYEYRGWAQRTHFSIIRNHIHSMIQAGIRAEGEREQTKD